MYFKYGLAPTFKLQIAYQDVPFPKWISIVDVLHGCISNCFLWINWIDWLTLVFLLSNSQTWGSGHLRKETSTADSRGGPCRCGEMGFSGPQETPPECGSGGRGPGQSLLRPEQDTGRSWRRWEKKNTHIALLTCKHSFLQ